VIFGLGPRSRPRAVKNRSEGGFGLTVPCPIARPPSAAEVGSDLEEDIMAEKYTPSGSYPATAVLAVPLVTAATAMVLAVPYAFAVWYNPVIYVSFVLTVFYGMAVGLIGGFISFRLSPVRNTKLAAFMGGIGVVPGWFLHTLIWLDLYKNRAQDLSFIGPEGMGLSWNGSTLVLGDLADFMVNYPLAHRFLMDILDYGVWSVANFTVRGIPYKAVWFLEFAIMVLMVMIRYVMKAKVPYSEENKQYYEHVILPKALVLPVDMEKLLLAFGRDEYGYVMVGAIEPEKKHSHLTVELYHLEDQTDGYLSVYLHQKSIKTNKITKVIDNVGIPYLQVSQLIKRLS
jgi:hypothetical protein